jgi:DNA polymerase-4
LAKVATDLQKPDGFTILAAGDLPDRLYPLALRDLPGIGRNMEHRLRMHGIGDMQTLLSLDSRKMRAAWGSVWGEKMWYFLRGFELPDEETTRRSIGHSHVMAPELRPPAQAIFVARRLMLKTASRLRRIGYFAQGLSVGARLENGPRIEASTRCYRAQDSFTFLRMLERLWERLVSQAPRGARIKKISITVHDLVGADALQEDLFEVLPEADKQEREKAEKISAALDKINHKFGRDSVLVGMLPSQGKSFSGSKIAFTRIPDIEEFLE